MEKTTAHRRTLLSTRREFLSRSAQGLGGIALGTIMDGSGAGPLIAAPEEGNPYWRGAVHPLHIPPRAKRIIYLYMAGGPSHLECFDHKPKLAEMDGSPMPDSLIRGEQKSAQSGGQRLQVLGPRYSFSRHGESGLEISSLFPHIAQLADEMCIIKSMVTEQVNHDPAHTFMNTGSIIQGRPSMGSWMAYGLGTESENLPGFVVMTSSGGGQGQPIAARQWHSGFLPGRFQGVKFESTGSPVNYVSRPPGVSLADQRELVETVKSLNFLSNDVLEDPEIQTRISQYEMAFRMQTSVPELVDFSSEPEYIRQMYGTEGADGSFAANCLLARRLAERGVRFVQLYHRGWDHHGNLKDGLKEAAQLVDRASAALVLDLKQRGMLEDTLVIWGGEFGRTPMGQGDDGRDHHIKCFSLWMAGGGIRPGTTYGRTDEFGYDVVSDRVHVHDLHATILHIMGIDHERLTYRSQGRDFRLTDVHGNLVKGILA
ncbi:MAG: DUF1501 domain-containing protein [Acidobacteriota bacterium]|nr:MAG: DUF1501 domain-containing protein [Acidobacteriota bacterium]